MSGPVAIEDIVDLDSFKAWLEQEDLPQEAMVALAHRAAMRVLPLAWKYFAFNERARKEGLTPLPVLRCGLVSGAAALGGAPETKKRLGRAATANAAANATYAATATANAAANATYAATATAARATYANATYAATATANAATATAAFDVWAEVWADCGSVGDIPALLRRPLWVAGENPLREVWDAVVEGTDLNATPEWEFWIEWYQRALDGREDRWDLLQEIALLDKDADGADLWEDAAKLAAEIARLEGEYAAREAEQPVDRIIDDTAPPEEVSVGNVKSAMVRNRRELPPTFNALTGFIALEIKRLQNRNYRDEDDRAECKRQIGVLLTLLETVEQLCALVPDTDMMSDADAEKAATLGALFLQKFKEWPRTNADELVDTTYRGALVAVTTVALPMIGVPATVALAAGVTLFGGKKIAEAVKSVRGGSD